MVRVITQPSKTHLCSRNLHAKDGPIFRFDSGARLSEPHGNYRSYLDMQQIEADAQRTPQPPRPLPPFQDRSSQFSFYHHVLKNHSKKTHACIIGSQIEPNVVVGNAFLNMYGKFDDLKDT